MSLKIRRGLAIDRLSITPDSGEFLWVTDSKLLYVGDGTTPGGIIIGGGGVSVVFQRITITGTVNGINDTFTCSSEPLQIFNSGRLMSLTDDYALSGAGNTIVTFVGGSIPFTGDILKAFGNL